MSQQPSQEILQWLKGVPSLKSTQIQKAREAAELRVKQELGAAPELYDYVQQAGERPEEPQSLGFRGTLREMMRLSDPLDMALPPLVFSLLAISLAHMFNFAGGIALSSYAAPVAADSGVIISKQVWTLIHQFGFSGVSEIPILYFFTRFNLERKKEKTEFSFFSMVGNLVAALVSVFITLIANVSSLLHSEKPMDGGYQLFLIFVGIALPLLTMFLGHRLSEILEIFLERRKEEKKNYEEKLRDYNNVVAAKKIEYDIDAHNYHTVFRHPETQSTFGQYLHQAIVEYYRQYLVKATGLGPEDWTLEHEMWLGRRERFRQQQQERFDEGMDFFEVAGGVTQ